MLAKGAAGLKLDFEKTFLVVDMFSDFPIVIALVFHTANELKPSRKADRGAQQLGGPRPIGL